MNDNMYVSATQAPTSTPVEPVEPVVSSGQSVMVQNSEATSPTSNLESIRLKLGKFFIGNFDGKDRFIKFDLNAFAEMEDIFGSMEAAQERLKSGSMKDIRTVLWLGLIWNEVILDERTGEPIGYSLSQYQVGSWLHTMNMKEVMEKLQQAMVGAMPKGDTTTMNQVAVATANDPN